MDLAAPGQAPPRSDQPIEVAAEWQQPSSEQVGARTRLPAWAVASAWSFGSLALVAVWLLLYAFTFSGLQESAAQHALYAQLRGEIANGIAPPFGPRLTLGTPIALLDVPQAGINDVVVAGTTAGVLEYGPGLETDTPMPGQPGVSVIYGRQTMFGGPFRHLSVLHRGDLLQVTTGQGVFTYKVQGLRYSGGPEPAPLSAGHSRLILVTGTGTGWRGAGAPNRLLYVDASLQGSPAASTGGVPSSLPNNQKPMQGDSSALIPLVFWLQLLLIVMIGAVWARSRWGSWQTWLVIAPAVLGVLWVASETGFQLLPNLL